MSRLFFTRGGENSLVNCLFNFWLSKLVTQRLVLCDVTQSLKLRRSSKELARCRNHLSQSFRTPRNEDSQNMKPLLTSKPRDNLTGGFEAHKLHTASFQAQKHTPSVHEIPGIPSLAVLWFYLAYSPA